MTVIAILLAAMQIIYIPLLVLVYKAGTKSTRIEERLTAVMEDIREDRKATNERLTYLEREVWKK